MDKTALMMALPSQEYVEEKKQEYIIQMPSLPVNMVKEKIIEQFELGMHLDARKFNPNTILNVSLCDDVGDVYAAVVFHFKDMFGIAVLLNQQQSARETPLLHIINMSQSGGLDISVHCNEDIQMHKDGDIISVIRVFENGEKEELLSYWISSVTGNMMEKEN